MGNYCSCNELDFTTEIKLCHKDYQLGLNGLQNLSLDLESDSLPYLEHPSSSSDSSFSLSNTQDLLPESLATMQTLKLSRILIKRPKNNIKKPHYP